MSRGSVHVAAQGVTGAGVQVGQQPVLPAIPQPRTGADDVGDGQQVQLTEPLAIAHHLGETVHHVRDR